MDNQTRSGARTPDVDDVRSTGDNAVAVEELSLPVYTAGFCLECRKLVQRKEDGRCPEGHDPESVVGVVRLDAEMVGKELPQLVSFNWGAFFIPMVWGPVHGLWAGLLCFPLWMFVDSVMVSAVSRGQWFLWVGAVAVAGITLLFMWWFAKTATIPAYLKLKRPIPIERFNRQQKVWGVVGAVFLVAVLALATYYNVTIRLA